MDHPPLTQEQIDILSRISNQPLEISTEDQIAQGLQDLGYLGQCGYLATEQTYTNPDMGKWRYKWTRTDKALP